MKLHPGYKPIASYSLNNKLLHQLNFIFLLFFRLVFFRPQTAVGSGYKYSKLYIQVDTLVSKNKYYCKWQTLLLHSNIICIKR